MLLISIYCLLITLINFKCFVFLMGAENAVLYINMYPVLALTVSQEVPLPSSNIWKPVDQIFSLTFRNSASVFLSSRLWSKTIIL